MVLEEEVTGLDDAGKVVVGIEEVVGGDEDEDEVKEVAREVALVVGFAVVVWLLVVVDGCVALICDVGEVEGWEVGDVSPPYVQGPVPSGIYKKVPLGCCVAKEVEELTDGP